MKELFTGVDFTNILLSLGLILLSSKLAGLLARKCKVPQVVGFLIAGLFLGPAIWGLFTDNFAFVHPSGELDILAEIGVILIMFSAGVETDVNHLKKSGLKSFAVAMCGVFVPLALGFAVSIPFIGLSDGKWISCLFVGSMLTATSVGITVETLKELKVISSEVGSIILSAAIIDDVIAIVVLSLVISLGNGSENPWLTLLKIVLFFIFAAVVGVALYYIFKWLEKKYPHTRRLPIFALATCFLFSWIAQELFGIADITGAYIAGVIMALNKKESGYIDRKLEINGYTFFTPIFFANIGLKISFDGFTTNLLLFGICFVLVGISAKIIGAGGIAKAMRYSWKDSLKIGVGMITRGEVGLIITEKGVRAGFIDPHYRVLMVFLILTSSLLAPILLKLLFKGENTLPLAVEDVLSPDKETALLSDVNFDPDGAEEAKDEFNEKK